MSATPIPRTLEMALTGIREMSTILTPPEERHPVLTYVGAYDDKQIAAAIRRELLRDGQVFYIHNRVRVDRQGRRAGSRELVPEARVAVGARPDERARSSSRSWSASGRRSTTSWSCTTIVESGLDIPNANTLIVERADTFGLSQLHQLRGRVGRGRERAYAYFLYPPEKPLTETAHDRLATIAQHTDLGAGMAVAMKDLEIRGAGNLLGGEQSGHIAGVGFDLYVRLVGEAVADYRGERRRGGRPSVEVRACRSTRTCRTTTSRASGCGWRPTAVAAVATDDDVAAVRDELVDRYGAAARAGAEPAGGGPVPVAGPHGRRHRGVAAGLQRPVRAGGAARVRPGPARPGSTRGAWSRRQSVRSWYRARRRPGSAGTPLRDTDLLDWARELIDTVIQPEAPTSPTA